MATKCSICRDVANMAAIDSLLDSGVSQKEVSKQFGISKFSLSRHVNHHRNQVEPASETHNDIQLWLSRCDDQYQAACFDNDSRAAIQSLAQGLRACEAKAKAAERRAEAKLEAGGDDSRISIGSLDQVMELFDQVPATPTDAAKLEEALRRARALNRVDAMQMFFRMIEDSAFAEDLVTFATSWTPAKKGESDEPILQVSAAN